jgi:hypothetical protein
VLAERHVTLGSLQVVMGPLLLLLLVVAVWLLVLEDGVY